MEGYSNTISKEKIIEPGGNLGKVVYIIPLIFIFKYVSYEGIRELL